eukprot:561664-Rhodomonas_salina.3
MVLPESQHGDLHEIPRPRQVPYHMLSSYATAMQCPVLPVLSPNATFGTDVAYGATSLCPVLR